MIHKKIAINLIQIFLVLSFLFIWQVLSDKRIINPFIFSSPKKIINTLIILYKSNNLIPHILVTLKEIFIAFLLSIIIGFIISIILYEVPIIYKIIDPFLTLFNSMPKVALGPIIIIIFGANNNSIIIMALSITLIVNILSIYNGFTMVDKNLFLFLKSINANRLQNLKYLIIPSAYKSIINSLKINISLTLIGVIMGEFLVSKNGIGYLIIYGSQIFNLNLVLTGIVILLIISYFLYLVISITEKYLNKKISG